MRRHDEGRGTGIMRTTKQSEKLETKDPLAAKLQ